MKRVSTLSGKRGLQLATAVWALGFLWLGLSGAAANGGAPTSTGELVQGRIVPKNGRLLAIEITEAEAGGFPEAFNQALGAGAEVVSLPLPWDELEPNPGTYSNPLPEIANLFYPQYGIRIALGVNPIDSDKPAMLELRRQARARGWTVTGEVTRPPSRPAERAIP